VFDLDGTLITSEALNRKSRQVVCERHGIDISEFDMRRLRGVPVEQSIDLLCQES
jgi:beta-phosphoglucomutase-like phosphatase (HAD superfamily)